MDKYLIMMCGPPASGKSTVANQLIELLDPSGRVEYISRDIIRFSMLNDGDDYFSKETEVFNKYIKVIKHCLNDCVTKYIIIDATHLNEKARNKVLNKLSLDYRKDIQIITVAMDTSLEECLSRNSKRTGRAQVPNSAIENMYKTYQKPTHNEFYPYYIMEVKNGCYSEEDMAQLRSALWPRP